MRCKGQCTVGELSMEVFGELFNNFPEIHHSLVHQSRKYDDHWKKFQIDILERVDYLKGLPHVLREQMHYKLILENFEQGAKVITRGTECTCIHFIISGEMELVVDRDNREHMLDILREGAVVGSYSIFNDSPYQFTGRARTSLSMLVLTQEDLLHLTEQHERLQDAIEGATEWVIDNEVPVCDYTIPKIIEAENDPFFGHLHRLRRAVHRVIILNRAREPKRIKIIELINFIRA